MVRASGAHTKMRKAAAVISDISEFAKRWGNRPVGSIAPRDVRQVLAAAVNRDAPYRAFNLLTVAKMFFKWVVSRDDEYGPLVSPCANLRAKDEIGKKLTRERVLNDAELRALWSSSTVLGYPYGPLLQLLALTGQRKSDVAEASWREFDLAAKTWVIPAARMKMAAAHVVPVTGDMITLLGRLPRFDKGDYLFSYTFGATPVNSFSKVKTALDRQMRAALGSLTPFVIHDIRRTVRTRLVGLEMVPGVKVPPHVAELIIAHAKPGLHKVYDLHSYDDEKRRALALWSAELRRIVT